MKLFKFVEKTACNKSRNDNMGTRFVDVDRFLEIYNVKKKQNL